jgi:hypothetical protein
MKYQNNISNKFVEVLNNHTNVKITFKTNSNLININNRIKNFIYISSFENAIIFKLKCNCNTFYLGKTYVNFKIKYEEHTSEIKLKKHY